MKRFFTVLLFSYIFVNVYSQTVITMTEDMGVYKVPCEVNGFRLNMVFDTGASTVCISGSLAELMVSNGYLAKSDFLNEGKALLADGSIIDHSIVNLQSIKIGDIVLKNIPASVIKKQNVSLLFGQSAIQMLGTYTIKGNKLIIQSSRGASSGAINNSQERWDAVNYTYSNFAYGFGWNLPDDVKWRKVDGQEKHTVFRVAADVPIVVFVNVQAADNPKNIDIWDTYDMQKTLWNQIDAEAEKRTGTIVYERTLDKSIILGQHALKSSYKSYMKDDRFKEAIETYTLEYSFLRNGFIMTAAVKMDKEMYDSVIDSDDFIASIFQGFRFTINR